MSDLAQWLTKHFPILIEVASSELSSDEALRATVEESIGAFYDALIHSARIHSTVPLHAILIDWVEARSAPTEGEVTGLIPVLATLKRVGWHQICVQADPEEAIQLLTQYDELFSDSANYLSALETEALLNDMRRELQKAETHVQRLDKSKSDFIAVAAHELKTPLTLIEGYTNMLRGEVTENDDPRVALMLSGIASGTLRLKETVDDMIDVSLIELRLLPLHFQPVWLHSLIHMVEFELSDAIRQRQITLNINHDELQEKFTYADPERLHQVFYKVVSNAIKYTPDRGTISISARELPGFTDIMVGDTGIGIATENLTRIFDKFSSMTEVSLHSSGKVKYKGAGPGLGLAIARGVLEAHGGSIWAESPGYDEKHLPGSIFHLMIPMRSAPPDPQDASLNRVSQQVAEIEHEDI